MTAKQLIAWFLTWRIGLLFIAFTAPIIVPQFGNRFPYTYDYLIPTFLPQWLWGWANFDGVHYLTIASRGYVAENTQAFFPLYPMLVGIVGTVFHGAYLLAGFVLSSVSTIAGLYIFKRLLEIDYNHVVVRWSILLLFVFPTSFYFGAVYTEGIFFLLVISSFYLARKGNWFLAGVLAALASATRFAGIFLLPALVVEYYLQFKGPGLFRFRKELLAVLVIPCGLFAYMYYLKTAFNDPFLFFNALPSFSTGRSNEIILLPQVFWRYLKILFDVPIMSLAYFNAVYELLVTIGIGILLAISVFKTRLSYAVFSIMVFISPTLTGTLTSMPRYVLLCFSAYIVVAMIQSSKLKVCIAIAMAALLVVSTILFIQGNWVA